METDESDGFEGWLEPLGIQVHLQTGSTKTRGPESGTTPNPGHPSLMIGTHALLESGVAMDNLGGHRS